MYGKTPISALEEYCAKKDLPKPIYDICETELNSSKIFNCLVHAIDEVARGVGRSKKEAKHDAAKNILKKLRISNPDLQLIPQATHDSIPVSDAVATLRDLCVEFDHPLPTFEVIQENGPSEAPEFVVECRVATIRRFALASTKKGAKQLAAKKLIDIINLSKVNNYENRLITIKKADEDHAAEVKKKIKTYRDFISSENCKPPGTRICERHKFFSKLDNETKKQAFDVLNSNNFCSAKMKFDDLMKVFDFEYKESEVDINDINEKTNILVEINCDIDAVFVGHKDIIYDDICTRIERLLK